MIRLHTIVFPAAQLVRAVDGPADIQPDRVRPIPPLGIAVPLADRPELAIGDRDQLFFPVRRGSHHHQDALPNFL
jgi:hypothetical protein